MDIRSPPMRMSVQRTTAPASRPRPVAISIFAGCGITQYRCVKSGLIFRAFPRTRSTSCSSRCRAVLGSLGPKLGPSFSQLHATCSRHGARVLPPASGGLPGRFPTFGGNPCQRVNCARWVVGGGRVRRRVSELRSVTCNARAAMDMAAHASSRWRDIRQFEIALLPAHAICRAKMLVLTI